VKKSLHIKLILKFILKGISYFSLTIIGFHAIFFAIVFFASVFLNFFNPPFTNLMIYRLVKNRYPLKKSKFIELKKIPESAKRMLLKIEDYKFYKHYGIDPEAILESYETNRRLGYIYRGGSTITQQLARTLFLTPKKSYVRKYFEILIAMEMELFLSKDRILELYFNYVEWGKGIYGIETASTVYYKKSVTRLNYDEIARLVTILASPIKYTPYTFENRAALKYRYSTLLSM